MSTITKESIEDTIEGLEHLASSGIQSVYIDMAIAGMRRLQASLEAEAVGYVSASALVCLSAGQHDVITGRPEKNADSERYWDVIPLYTAPPAPVDNIHPLLEFAREYIESWDLGMAGDSSLLASAKKAIADSSAQQPAPFVLPVQHWEDLCRQNPDMSIGDAIIRAAWWNHCAAMLQGADGNYPVVPDGWVACSERMPDPDSEFRICAYTPTPHEDVRFRFVPASLFKSVCRDATHWQYMLPPATPQPEVKQ